MSSNSNDLPSVTKLQWACRRGMLELDVLLSNFLQSGYADLELVDKRHFALLLTYTDPELFDWLINTVPAPTVEIQQIVDKIRQHARSRFNA